MATHKPDETIAQYLADQGIGIYNQLGANIFIGPVQPPNQYIPAKSCWILETGGLAPEYVMGNAYTVQRSTVQVRVRGDANDYIGGRDFAQSIYDALNGIVPTGYFSVFCQQSEPVWIGFDSDNRPEWSINLIVTYQENK